MGAELNCSLHTVYIVCICGLCGLRPNIKEQAVCVGDKSYLVENI